jgi:hypothetical protein
MLLTTWATLMLPTIWDLPQGMTKTRMLLTTWETLTLPTIWDHLQDMSRTLTARTVN